MFVLHTDELQQFFKHKIFNKNIFKLSVCFAYPQFSVLLKNSSFIFPFKTLKASILKNLNTTFNPFFFYSFELEKYCSKTSSKKNAK